MIDKKDILEKINQLKEIFPHGPSDDPKSRFNDNLSIYTDTLINLYQYDTLIKELGSDFCKSYNNIQQSASNFLSKIIAEPIKESMGDELETLYQTVDNLMEILSPDNDSEDSEISDDDRDESLEACDDDRDENVEVCDDDRNGRDINLDEGEKECYHPQGMNITVLESETEDGRIRKIKFNSSVKVNWIKPEYNKKYPNQRPANALSQLRASDSIPSGKTRQRLNLDNHIEPMIAFTDASHLLPQNILKDAEDFLESPYVHHFPNLHFKVHAGLPRTAHITYIGKGIYRAKVFNSTYVRYLEDDIKYDFTHHEINIMSLLYDKCRTDAKKKHHFVNTFDLKDKEKCIVNSLKNIIDTANGAIYLPLGELIDLLSKLLSLDIVSLTRTPQYTFKSNGKSPMSKFQMVNIEEKNSIIDEAHAIFLQLENHNDSPAQNNNSSSLNTILIDNDISSTRIKSISSQLENLNKRINVFISNLKDLISLPVSIPLPPAPIKLSMPLPPAPTQLSIPPPPIHLSIPMPIPPILFSMRNTIQSQPIVPIRIPESLRVPFPVAVPKPISIRSGFASNSRSDLIEPVTLDGEKARKRDRSQLYDSIELTPHYHHKKRNTLTYDRDLGTIVVDISNDDLDDFAEQNDNKNKI